MNITTIHDSGRGADRMKVDSYGNGWGYAIQFGEAGTSMRTLWFQDDDAMAIRDGFDRMETSAPNIRTRDIWWNVLEPYL